MKIRITNDGAEKDINEIYTLIKDYNLSHMSSLGVSNEILKDSASLTYSSGKLLLIKTKKEEEVRDEK